MSGEPIVSSDKKMIALIDWLTVSFKSDFNYLQLLDCLNMTLADFETKNGSRFGNEFRLSSGGGVDIHYSIGNDKELVLDISGQGCRYLEKKWRDLDEDEDFLCGYRGRKVTNWLELLQWIIDNDVYHFTRLDLAIDDFKGYLDISKMATMTKQGKNTHKLRSFDYHMSGKVNGEYTGQTLYIGKFGGQIMFRFYDKLAEREKKNKILHESINLWYRYEVCLRSDRADKLCRLLAAGDLHLGQTVMGLMKEYLCFRNPDGKNKNKARWKICKWWSDFLCLVEPLQLTLDTKEDTFYKSRAWVTNVSSTLSLITERYGYDEEILQNLFELGKLKQKDRHKKMLEVLDRDPGLLEQERQVFLNEIEREKIEIIKKRKSIDEEKRQKNSVYQASQGLTDTRTV